MDLDTLAIMRLGDRVASLESKVNMLLTQTAIPPCQHVFMPDITLPNGQATAKCSLCGYRGTV